MGKNAQRLVTVLLRFGQAKLAEVWDISSAEVSRKINGESGIKLEQLASALEMVGARIVEHDQVIVDADELEALRTLARKALERRD